MTIIMRVIHDDLQDAGFHNSDGGMSMVIECDTKFIIQSNCKSKLQLAKYITYHLGKLHDGDFVGMITAVYRNQISDYYKQLLMLDYQYHIASEFGIYPYHISDNVNVTPMGIYQSYKASERLCRPPYDFETYVVQSDNGNFFCTKDDLPKLDKLNYWRIK
jgi:hypothetical protein